MDVCDQKPVGTIQTICRNSPREGSGRGGKPCVGARGSGPGERALRGGGDCSAALGLQVVCRLGRQRRRKHGAGAHRGVAHPVTPWRVWTWSEDIFRAETHLMESSLLQKRKHEDGVQEAEASEEVSRSSDGQQSWPGMGWGQGAVGQGKGASSVHGGKDGNRRFVDAGW